MSRHSRSEARERLEQFIEKDNRKVFQVCGAYGVGKSFIINKACEVIDKDKRVEPFLLRREEKYINLDPYSLCGILHPSTEGELDLATAVGAKRWEAAIEKFKSKLMAMKDEAGLAEEGESFSSVVWISTSNTEIPSTLLEAMSMLRDSSLKFIFERRVSVELSEGIWQKYRKPLISAIAQLDTVGRSEFEDAVDHLFEVKGWGTPANQTDKEVLLTRLEHLGGRNFALISKICEWIGRDLGINRLWNSGPNGADLAEVVRERVKREPSIVNEILGALSKQSRRWVEVLACCCDVIRGGCGEIGKYANKSKVEELFAAGLLVEGDVLAEAVKYGILHNIDTEYGAKANYSSALDRRVLVDSAERIFEISGTYPGGGVNRNSENFTSLVQSIWTCPMDNFFPRLAKLVHVDVGAGGLEWMTASEANMSLAGAAKYLGINWYVD